MYLARGHAQLVERVTSPHVERARVIVDLGEVVSLAHAESQALVHFFPERLDASRSVVHVRDDASTGVLLLVRFADIECLCELDALVRSGAPAPAGSWSFHRVTL